jgi:hypothetical protein
LKSSDTLLSPRVQRIRRDDDVPLTSAPQTGTPLASTAREEPGAIGARNRAPAARSEPASVKADERAAGDRLRLFGRKVNARS